MNARIQFDWDSSHDAPSACRTFRSYIEVLGYHAAVQGQRLALTELPNLRDEGRRFTYADIDRRCRAIGAYLQALGATGQRALLAFDNDADYLLCFLGCLYAGAIAVPLFAPTQRSHVDRFKSVAPDCQARFLLTNSAAEGRNPRMGLTRQEFPNLRWILSDEIDDSWAGRWEPHAPAPDELAYLQYTSGSTGAPRGVMVTHGNLMYQGRFNEVCADVRPHDRALSWLPLYHDMGLIVGALQPLFSGKPLWLSNPMAAVMHPERWIRAIGELRITHSGAPNFFYDLCTDSVDLARLSGLDLSSWSVAFNGAEPVRAATLERFTRKFSAFGLRATTPLPAYGLAEATLTVAMNRRDAPPVVRRVDAQMLANDRIVDVPEGRPGHLLVSNGRPGLDTRVRIVAPGTRTPCPADTVGEIWVAGPTVAQGYWGQHETTRDTFHACIEGVEDRFLRTGDLGFLDADNHLFVTGRSKDLIIVAGKNHYPQDIEQTVETVEGIRPRGAVALPVQAEAGEAVAVLAEVQPQPGRAVDFRRLADEIRARASSQHELRVREVVFLQPGQLPMTTSGKIQRRACLSMLEADRFRILERISA